jgi:phosphatidylserine decarboxylase
VKRREDVCERDDDNILQMRKRKKKLFIVTKYERMNHRIFEAKNRRAVLLGKWEEFFVSR